MRRQVVGQMAVVTRTKDVFVIDKKQCLREGGMVETMRRMGQRRSVGQCTSIFSNDVACIRGNPVIIMGPVSIKRSQPAT